MSGETDRSQLFYRVAQAISSSLNLDDTLQAILSATQELLGVEGIVLRLLDPDGRSLAVTAAAGVASQPPGPVTLGASPYDGVLTGSVCPVAPGVVAIPMQVRDRVVGTLDVLCPDDLCDDAPTAAMLKAVADLAATAVENAQLHSALFSIAQAVTSSLQLRPMLDQVLAATVMEMGLKAASVRLLDKSGKHLELVAAQGLSEHYLHKGAVLVSRSPMDQKLLAGEPVALFNVAEEPGFQYPTEAEAEGIRSVLAVPLRVRERVVGVMRVYSARPRPFTAVGSEFLQSVAGLVAVAIENARLYEALQARYEGLKADVNEWYKFLSLG